MKVSSDTYQGCNNIDRKTVRDRSTVVQWIVQLKFYSQKKEKNQVDKLLKCGGKNDMIYNIYTVVSTLSGKKKVQKLGQYLFKRFYLF